MAAAEAEVAATRATKTAVSFILNAELLNCFRRYQGAGAICLKLRLQESIADGDEPVKKENLRQ